MLVFTYGSLLCPASLLGTVPTVRLQTCVPARCRGYLRGFDVAFPNDGTQPDKSYVAADGRRPGVVLFADLRAAHGRFVNGVCVPVDERDLQLLRERERRYRLIDLSDRVLPYPGFAALPGPVLGFVGSPCFTGPERVARGVVPRSYLRAIQRGVRHWSVGCPGFQRDFEASTCPPPASAELRRIDHR